MRSGPSYRNARRSTTTEAAAPDAAPEYGSDLVVDLLASLGVDKLAMSPGATFRGLHDSLVNYAPDAVEVVDCLHEEISVAIAHGYAKAAGRPMAAAVHDVVGLQHASMAVFNAWCDRVPMLILGGSGPRDAARRRPWIDWIHTADPQSLQVRDYTKWDDEPASLEALPDALLRAFHLSVTDPCGPVYVALDAELQEQELPADLPDASAAVTARFGRPAPDPHSVEHLARWLVMAERPAIVADLVGRSEVAFASLVELAELLAVPVIDPEGEYWKVSLNFPTQHPMNLSGLRQETLSNADLIVGLEARDLSGAIGASDAKLAHVSVSHLITGSWANDYQRFQPVDLHLCADLASTLPVLVDLVRTLVEADPSAPARIEQRRAGVADRSARMRAAWRVRAAAGDEEGEPISWWTLALALDEATAGHDRVIAYGHLGNWIHRLWDLDHPSQYLGGSGGAGLGYGLGASVGAALAHRGSGRLVIDIQADGDALFTPQALWTAAHHRLPLLVVLDNNQAYNNSVQHAGNVARRRRRDPENRLAGTAIGGPVVDFPALARSFGVFAEDPVERPELLGPALRRAVAHVTEDGLPALVDVRTRRHTTKFDEGSQHER